MQVEQNPSFFALFKRAFKGDMAYDFTQGSIGQAAFLLAVPMVLEMLMESLFAITDIFFVAKLGSDAVAVVGLTEAVITLMYALAIGAGMGTTAMVARRIGEKNVSDANSYAAQALWLGLFISLMISVVGFLYARPILEFVGANPQVSALGTDYTTIMLCGSGTIMYLFIINAIFRGAGDATIAMRSLWIANGINIILDPILIFGLGPFPEMGVTGAAVATTIGRSIGVAYQVYHLFGNRGRISLRLVDLGLQLNKLWQLIKVSTGGVMQFLIATASWLLLMRVISQFGSAAIAGYTIAIRVVLFTILPAWGLSNAAATLVGQNLGAQQIARAEKSVWMVTKYNVYFMLSIAVLFLLFAEPIMRIFTNVPEVIAVGVNCLRYISLGYGFFAVGMVLVQAFNGAGDTKTPTLINFFCYWLFQIPLAYFLAESMGLGPDGVFISITLAESLLAGVGLWMFRLGYWKRVSV